MIGMGPDDTAITVKGAIRWSIVTIISVLVLVRESFNLKSFISHGVHLLALQ
jgi:hypothetical protein